MRFSCRRVQPTAISVRAQTLNYAKLLPTAILLAHRAQTVKKYLDENPRVKWVWYDEWCMPQGKNKTPDEKAEFKTMLANINMLYLSTRVLILYDLSYNSRFWTQFEAWVCPLDSNLPLGRIANN